MRVNISYSIDLEEVPEKVKEILQKDISKVKREALPSLDEAVEALSVGDINRAAIAAGEVEKAGQVLHDVTTKLADYSNILKGFLNAKIQLAEQANRPPSDPLPSPPQAEPADDREQETEQEDESEV